MYFFVDAPIVISWWDSVAPYLACWEVGSANSEWRTWLFCWGNFEKHFFVRRDYCHWIWFWSLLRDRSSMIDSMQNMSLVIMWQKDWCKKVDHVKPKPSFKNTWASKEQKHHEHHPVSVTREDIQRRENLVTKPLPIKIKTSQLNLRINGTNFPKDNRNE